MVRLDLALIPAPLRARARQAFVDGDVVGFFCLGNSSVPLALLQINEKAFKRNGSFEKALLYAWTHQKVTIGLWKNIVPNKPPIAFRWDSWVGEQLLCADRGKLLALSDPLPSGDVFTVYRGVGGFRSSHHLIGAKCMREPHELSWSLSPDTARLFMHWPHRSALYQTTIKRSDVLAYIDTMTRGEQEVLVVLHKRHPVKRLSVARPTEEEVPGIPRPQ